MQVNPMCCKEFLYYTFICLLSNDYEKRNNSGMYWKGEENLSLHLLSTDFLLEVYTNAIELNDNKDFILLLEKELNNRQSINRLYSTS
ncbi:sporulation histidine kinase inhibitor Sda [Halalkalibacter flavus]|uniref:sporulation histidine kinase inhibitor Sda n=1 Tax=Halalkalibacter flavus TaxID=3090668 RepID=UPI003D66BB68